ncbi:uncharacterized protein LOC134265811 [Saccostrea cucullata]|uniref:uncharacterized protein LOC134265811 n=1 Tax=Saccostrea cuccullata TaxID=36930 RepID=UPI002ED34F58
MSLGTEYSDNFEFYDDSSGQQTVTPSGTISHQSQQPGSQYWDSNFPSLLSSLGVEAKLPKVRRIRPPLKRQISGSTSQKTPRDSSKARTRDPSSEEPWRRNEARWLKVENIVREKMEQFDHYYTQLVSHNEATRAENDRNSHQLYNKLWLEEEKRRKAVVQGSTYDRIWRHHALMRQRGEDEWRRKMERNSTLQYDSVDVSFDEEALK